MMYKRLLSITTAVVLTAGFMAFKPAVKPSDAGGTEFQTGGVFDGAIANEERLIQMLKNSGKIARDAVPEQAEEILHKYLNESAKASLKRQNTADFEKGQIAELKAKLETTGLVNGSGKKIGNVNVTPAQQQPYNGAVRKDKVLVLLIDFPDYPHNSITPDETDMYYENYSAQHFQDMIFGNNGYAGPNGEKLMSMKQYYEEQSGGSYTIDGTIARWYTAKYPAAYYGAHIENGGNDIRPRDLVYEALLTAAQDPSINLADYDQLDPYDLDGDGNIYEPDGIIDHLMVFHSGVGEEAGGGKLGEDAIWSHSWNLGGVATIPGTSANVKYWGGSLAAYRYTIEPEDGATGVFAHEFGHDLGLPDEYDTIYSGSGEAVSSWSIMANGSWAGKVPGTEPTSFSPYAKEFFQAAIGGNWLKGTTVSFNDITKDGIYAILDQSTTKGNNDGAVRINLPDKVHNINVPASGKYEYWGGTGKDGMPIDNSMVTSLDLTGKTSVSLNFKAWYDIEEGWDFASIQVKEQGTDAWTAIPGNITTTDRNPDAEVRVANGITGSSKGQWVNARFDLSAYAGRKVELKFEYETDPYTFGEGFYVDDVNVTADGSTILSDSVEDAPRFDLSSGFAKSDGTTTSTQYYLVEWRNHAGADMGLAHINAAGSIYSYDPGMVVWYVDDYYSDNWVGVHPGEGFLGVVDADQHVDYWDDANYGKIPASTRYQIHDAAFSLDKTGRMFVDVSSLLGWTRTMLDKDTSAYTTFDDSIAYTNSAVPQSGRDIPKLGLKIRVVGEASDKSSAKILIYK